MKVITATEASRRFAAVLDEAEHGETIVVTRGGRRVAVIGPAPVAAGRAVKEMLRRHRRDDGVGGRRPRGPGRCRGRAGRVARRLILDTGVLIRAERGRARLDRVLGDDDDVAIAAITAAELLVGVELADGSRRAARAVFVDDVIATVAGRGLHARRRRRARAARSLAADGRAVRTT